MALILLVERPILRLIATAHLRQPTCDNAQTADLPRLLACGLEIHVHPTTKSPRLAQFARTCPRKRMSSLRMPGRSHWPRIPTRIRTQRPRNGDPGDAFFCSNRYAKSGCGRTFPIYWSDVIPSATLRTYQLLELLRAVASACSVQAAWHGLRTPISLRGAHRWLASWKRATATIRSHLGRRADPPGKADGCPDPLSLHHLHAAFPQEVCAIAAYQDTFQRAIITPPPGQPT